MTNNNTSKFNDCIMLHKDDIPGKRELLQAALRLYKDATIYDKIKSGSKEGFDAESLSVVAAFLEFLIKRNIHADNPNISQEIPDYDETRIKRLCTVCGEGSITFEDECQKIEEIYLESIADKSTVRHIQRKKGK